jgi:hypothetical protein
MSKRWLPLPRARVLATVYLPAAYLAAACLAAPACATDAGADAAAHAATDSTAHAATDAATDAAVHAPAAAGADAAASGGPAEWQPVAEQMLADARGGFETGNGLLVALSVDRVLSLNGNTIASGQLSMDAAALAGRSALSTFQVARVGEGSALVQAAQPLAGLALQNSANDQLIRSQTTIDATVNSLSILNDMHFGDSLRQSLSTAILPR